jgi:signal transduction histidine kinase
VGHVPVMVDPIKFPWVFANLMSNALRVTPAQGAIHVSLEKEMGETRITVSDEGPGVPPEIENRVFEPYFKAASGSTEHLAGFLGIGLTIAKEVAEAHGGKIRYHKGEPTGAVFTVTIPLAGARI